MSKRGRSFTNSERNDGQRIVIGQWDGSFARGIRFLLVNLSIVVSTLNGKVASITGDLFKMKMLPQSF